MLFNSSIFCFLFLPITILLHRIIDKKYKEVFLLLASLFFYAWTGIDNLKFVLLLLFINYIFFYLNNKFRNKILLFFIISLNIFLIIHFKYATYLISNINSYFSLNISFSEVIAPLGISFIVFHAISLQIDVYRDKNLFNRNLSNFALYLLFFPKVMQGPIILYKDFVESNKFENYSFNFFCTGVERFIIGLSKKVIIADVLFNIVNEITLQMHTSSIDQISYWIIAICYMFVIYYDFSGYSDMAIGISRMLGFNFKENFNFPYTSTSVTEFWKRWHISLGSWFKEYVYIPLGGNRRGNIYFNLSVVFILTGVWHGAGLLYLFWGLLHGFFCISERYFRKKGILIKIPKLLGMLYTNCVVGFGWLIFLFPRWTSLFPFLMGLFGMNESGYILFTYEYIFDYKLAFTLLIAIIGAYCLCAPRLIQLFNKLNEQSKAFNACKYFVLLILFVYSLMSIISGTYSPFIYFQY